MGKYKYLMISLGVAFATLIALLLYLNIGCRYSGTEFSPDDFTVRNFSYLYEPITGSVISGRTFDDDYYSYLPSLPTLVADKYIKPVFKKEKTWHLLEDNGIYYRGHSADSDARLLVNFLLLFDENRENTWTVWNSDHPNLAKVLWPLIAEMARDEVYLTVGDVLTFVLDADYSDQKQFTADLRQEVAKAYLKVAKIDFQNDNLESAEHRVKKSIKFDSNADAKALLNSIGSVKPTAEEPISSSE